MMPLVFADDGEVCVIRGIKGTDEIRHHLSNLGFVVGGTVQIISRMGGNVIVNV